jgi:hypothetical protein
MRNWRAVIEGLQRPHRLSDRLTGVVSWQKSPKKQGFSSSGGSGRPTQATHFGEIAVGGPRVFFADGDMTRVAVFLGPSN